MRLELRTFFVATETQTLHDFFFLKDPPPTEISTLPLHAALPIWGRRPFARPCPPLQPQPRRHGRSRCPPPCAPRGRGLRRRRGRASRWRSPLPRGAQGGGHR